ncbi:hypothetical protein [Nocardiopsis sp. N85]|uniref:hypothetical protein n=1 Tax=Nocardiopsis sp. N85 TaxID=3029400 RepID=UPI00237F0548|nr:hypothetical protein [Nocardiopsis sp. N85]
MGGVSVDRARTLGEVVRAVAGCATVPDRVVVERALTRVLAGTPVEEFVDAEGLARVLVAAVVGARSGAGVDPVGAERALAALEQVAEVASVLHTLDPRARRALRIRLRHRAAAGALG